MTIRDFSDNHGLKAIVRRHAVYCKPSLPVDANIMCALIYSRTIDSNLLGLSVEGMEMMFHQGELLAEMGIVINRIITGIDLRNYEGGIMTAAGINRHLTYKIPVLRSPAVTYPYYDPTKVPAVWEKYGDMAVHAYLSGRPGTEGLWTESADEFNERIYSAIHNTDYSCGPVLFDLNFEQLVSLHYAKALRKHIPCDGSAWIPKNGGGIVYGTDGTVAEFNPDFTLVE